MLFLRFVCFDLLRWLHGTRLREQSHTGRAHVLLHFVRGQQQQHRQLQHPTLHSNPNETTVRQRVIYILLNAIDRRIRTWTHFVRSWAFGRRERFMGNTRLHCCHIVQQARTSKLCCREHKVHSSTETIPNRDWRSSISRNALHGEREWRRVANGKQKPYSRNSKRSKALVNTSVDALSVMFDVLGIYTKHFNRWESEKNISESLGVVGCSVHVFSFSECKPPSPSAS